MPHIEEFKAAIIRWVQASTPADQAARYHEVEAAQRRLADALAPRWEGVGHGWSLSPEAREKIERLVYENTQNASDLQSIVLATLPTGGE